MSASTAESPTGATRAGGSGLFIGSWRIGTHHAGAPGLVIHCTFDAASGSVHGLGRIVRGATEPPLDRSVRLDGDYTYLTVLPEASHIMLTLTGYPVLHWPAHGGTGPAAPAVLNLRLMLGADWQSGTATFQYCTADEQWHTIESAPGTVITDAEHAGTP
ncbi:hypothetical protein GCM10010123_18390 [Pilimelia anulata]|uniref:DUF1842 domain-containing protein n=1 Tax=Pilimelia anulata TaxID=53371 RepID=A0A8J3B2D8_9ACTN|nr:DUF1842 domain-containing protein [Pilimelia anulata]GGJ89161.1 hypothetical protein GCM10010123_18390 [Pilimelia anulata]